MVLRDVFGCERHVVVLRDVFGRERRVVVLRDTFQLKTYLDDFFL